jgi:hypothetical protein
LSRCRLKRQAGVKLIGLIDELVAVADRDLEVDAVYPANEVALAQSPTLAGQDAAQEPVRPVDVTGAFMRQTGLREWEPYLIG